MPVRIAIIGYGKIARDQHAPAIRNNPAFDLVAVVGPQPASPPGVPAFPDLAALLAAMPVDAVSICTPAGVRHGIAREALAAGLHVLLEKPPAATVGAIEALRSAAAREERTLFTAWHAQHNAAVAAARRQLADAGIARLSIVWREDVRKWHPGQTWIWAPGGFGVFDPGINALSIATAILPTPLIVTAAELAFPANRQTPIAAWLLFEGSDHRAEMDWRHSADECWTIGIDTTDGRRIDILEGGAVLVLDGVRQPLRGPAEYDAVYARFAELIAAKQSDVDAEPLRIVADACLVGRRSIVDPFD